MFLYAITALSVLFMFYTCVKVSKRIIKEHGAYHEEHLTENDAFKVGIWVIISGCLCVISLLYAIFS